jgi:phenylalanyl-tRNA synthetase beta chain
MVVSGAPDPWDRPAADPDRYLELKGAVESLLGALGIDSWRTGSYHESCWASGTGVNWSAAAGRLGRMGELAPALAGSAGLGRPAWAAVLDLSILSKASPQGRRYRDVPRFPASKRDLAVLVRPEATHETLVESIRAAGGPLLQEVRLFDVYEFRDGEHQGKRSMAFALEFRSLERTLTDREVESAIAAIVTALSSKHGAEVRGAAGEARRA